MPIYAKEVECIETGEIFESAAAAGRAKHCDPSNIHKTCNGIGWPTCGGFHWRYTGKIINLDPPLARRNEAGFTFNQQRYMDALEYNPFLRLKEASKLLGISQSTIKHWFTADPKFIEAYNQVMDAKWKHLQAAAQETMSNLVEEGDFQASKYVLSSLGRDAKQQIEVSAPEAFTINIGGDNVSN